MRRGSYGGGMDVPTPWLPRPDTGWSHGLERRLRGLAAWSLGAGDAGWIEAPPPVAPWSFLTWLGEIEGCLLHGSADPAIDRFTPRSPADRSPDAFSKQRAVFATSDGIWAAFYAILDRQAPSLRFLNAALQFRSGSERWSRMHYYFSVSARAPRAPWRPGVVYVLPPDGFRRQRPYRLGSSLVREPHYANPRPVRPLARMRVTPRDFPFLESVARHDPDVVDARAAADPHGFPWLEP